MYYHGSRAYVPGDRLDTMLTTRRLLGTGGLLAVVIAIGVAASAIVGDSSKGTRAGVDSVHVGTAAWTGHAIYPDTIRPAVVAGKMSADHGHEKWAAVRKMDKRGLGAAIGARLRAGIDAGKITQEQADERLEAWKEKLKNPAEVLKAAVAAGKITQEQADERLRSMEGKAEKPG